MKILRKAAIALVLCWSIACKREPSDFSDCILRSVKAGMSEGAVRLVTVACRQKFPETENRHNRALTELPESAKNRLTGHFGPSIGSTWSGNIYNATEDWTVEEVTLVIRPMLTNIFDQTSDATATPTSPIATEPELYRVDVRVSPLSNAEFSVSVNWPSQQDFTWAIASARGWRS
ncbi:MAG TPA: hypothetical protein VLB76_28735 [Thermoanaerobaculia bacterium]|nr:hypothetical protein [Thermoanaerobaculia bacterium]